MTSEGWLNSPMPAVYRPTATLIGLPSNPFPTHPIPFLPTPPFNTKLPSLKAINKGQAHFKKDNKSNLTIRLPSCGFSLRVPPQCALCMTRRARDL